MRTLITRFVLALCTASALLAQTTPTLRQQAANSGADVAQVTLTLSQVPLTGNVLVITHDVTSSSNSTVTGGGVATWTLCKSSLPDRSNSQIWAGIVGSAPTSTITVRLGSSPNCASANVSEWSGLGSSLVFEGRTAIGNGLTVTTGSVPFAANDLVVATVGTHGGGQTLRTPTNGFTDFTRPTSQRSSTLAASWRVPTAAGTGGTGWTMGYSHGWATVIVVFHNQSTGGGGGTGGGGTGGGGTGGGGTGGGGTGGGTTTTALVQQAVNAAAGIGSLTVTLPTLPVPGNVIILSHDSTSGGNSRVTGGGVATWTLCATTIPAQDNSEIFAGVVGSSPSRTITLTLGGSPNSAAVVATEWSGLRTPLVFEARATNGSGGVSPPAATGTVTTNINDVVIAMVGAHGGGETFAAPTGGFTALLQPAGQPSSVMAAAYLKATAAGAAQATWRLGYNHLWAAGIVAFRAQTP